MAVDVIPKTPPKHDVVYVNPKCQTFDILGNGYKSSLLLDKVRQNRIIQLHCVHYL